MRRLVFILALGFVVLIGAKVYADSGRVTIVLLIDSACEKQEMIKKTVSNPMACVDGPLYRTMADYQAIQQWVNVVYVVDYTWDPVLGQAWIEENYAISTTLPLSIAHEIKHLQEETHCTSDAYHDDEYLCKYTRLNEGI